MADKEKKVNKKDLELEKMVEEERITLVDNNNIEYEFIILDRLSLNDGSYLALVSCDSKDDRSTEAGPGDGDDITIIKEEMVDGEPVYSAVSDADDLLALTKQLEKKYGHLTDVV